MICEMAVEAIDSLKRLKLVDENDEQKKVVEPFLESIISIITSDGCDRNSFGKDILDHGLLPEIRRLIESEVCLEKSAQLIAELAKSVTVREECVNEGLVPLFVDCLCNENMAVCMQACRALGNICYDNDVGRHAVECCCGVEKLIDLLKRYFTEEINENLSKLRIMACGFLLNLTNANESLQEKALELGALAVLEQYVTRYSDDEDICTMMLMAISSLVDFDGGKQKAYASTLPESVISQWQTHISSELDDAVIELLANLAENDDMKTRMTQSKLPSKLIFAIDKNEAEESEDDGQQVLRLAADLIVLLLTGEKSMDILYENGQGLTFKESKKWLSSSNSHLRMSGSLAMGNFARSDEHCIQLARDGITEKLLDVLKSADGNDKTDFTLQHGALSALRNLSIPAENKPIILKSGVLQHALKLVSSDMAPVQFKLLGLIRMVIDGQEAAANLVGNDEDFIKKLVGFCDVKGHPGVKGEANRLLAWLIKNSKSMEVMSLLLKHGGLPHIVSMVSAEYPLMQNEALLSLVLLSSCFLDSMAEELKELGIVQSVLSLFSLQEKYPEILLNTLSLLKVLLQSGVLQEAFLETSIKEKLSVLSENDNKIGSKAREVLAVLDQG